MNRVRLFDRRSIPVKLLVHEPKPVPRQGHHALYENLLGVDRVTHHHDIAMARRAAEMPAHVLRQHIIAAIQRICHRVRRLRVGAQEQHRQDHRRGRRQPSLAPARHLTIPPQRNRGRGRQPGNAELNQQPDLQPQSQRHSRQLQEDRPDEEHRRARGGPRRMPNPNARNSRAMAAPATGLSTVPTPYSPAMPNVTHAPRRTTSSRSMPASYADAHPDATLRNSCRIHHAESVPLYNEETPMKPALRTPALRLSLAFAAVAIAAVLFSQSAPRERVGPLPDGGFLLNSGWKLAPAGKQIPLDTLPMSSALSLDGKYLFVLNAGYRPPSVTVMDAASGSVLSSQKLADGWLGLAVGPSRDRVYVGGGTTAHVN